MREQSYKERKKKLMQNIKGEIEDKKKQALKLMDESYHSTSSNNGKSKSYFHLLLSSNWKVREN